MKPSSNRRPERQAAPLNDDRGAALWADRLRPCRSLAGFAARHRRPGRCCRAQSLIGTARAHHSHGRSRWQQGLRTPWKMTLTEVPQIRRCGSGSVARSTRSISARRTPADPVSSSRRATTSGGSGRVRGRHHGRVLLGDHLRRNRPARPHAVVTAIAGTGVAHAVVHHRYVPVASCLVTDLLPRPSRARRAARLGHAPRSHARTNRCV